MKSPFPGMDPYLEEHWRDVHHRFLTYACDVLQERLPGDLRARLEERVFVEPDQCEARSIYPDLRVIEYPRGRSAGGGVATAGAAVAEPIVIQAGPEPTTEGYIEIVDVGSGNRVVTVIELLSESNKYPGDGQMMYRKKQSEYLRAGVSLVELDLLRAGQRVLAVPAGWVPASHRTTYQVCVVRGWKRGCYELYRAPLRDRLPTIKVPLREQDVDVPLDLQMLIDRCYHHGRYDDIDYRADPDPPLPPDDAAWAHELLVNQGLRPAAIPAPAPSPSPGP
jgi:hypothetical protein